MFSGSVKKPRYTFLFCQKVPAGESLPDSLTYLLINLCIPKALRKEHLFMFPRSGASMETPIPEPYLTYLSGSPVKDPCLQVPLMESLQ
jgi:hypothetical protein